MENQNKKFWIGLVVGIGITAVLTIILTTAALYLTGGFDNDDYKKSIISSEKKDDTKDEGNTDSKLDYNPGDDAKANSIQEIIDRYYLNTVTEDAVAEGVYKGIMASLDDPYSVYYTKEEYESIQASTQGTYCGIGAMVSQNVNTGIITIVKVYQGTPAEKFGLLAGDIIYKVAGEEVTGVDLTTVVTKMKGEEGTDVEIVVAREGESDYITKKVTRARIEVPTIEYEMLADKIGYIAVSEFDEVTAQQFRDALKDLESQGEQALIIDLRDNGGGVLSTAVDMLDRMIADGMLVYTETKEGVDEEFKAEDGDSFDKPLAVLVNGNSASASEVFSGAIQDYGIGKLIGTTTFGKGIVQSIIPLGDGSALKLTTAKYYTPKGRNIHDAGLKPDVEVELSDEAKKKSPLEKKDDNQLQTAIKELKKELKK